MDDMLRPESMNTIDIKEIKCYLDEVEADLMEQELDHTGLTMVMHKLYEIIDNLMDVVMEEKNVERKILLSLLQYKARQLYSEIKLQLAVQN